MLYDKGNDFWFNSTAIQAPAGNVDSVSIDLGNVPTRRVLSGKHEDVGAMVHLVFGTAGIAPPVR